MAETETGEVAPKPIVGTFITIAEMPPNFFWLRPKSIGASKEEAAGADGLPADRMAELKAAAHTAFQHLLCVEPAGRG